MPNSSNQPKKNYLARIYGAGRIIGKTLAANSHRSAKERMGEMHGKHYKGFQGKWLMPGPSATRQAAAGKYMTKFQRQLAELKIGNRSQNRFWKPGQHGLTESNIREIAYPKWVKMFGAEKADRLLRAQGLDTPHNEYSGGKQVALKKAEARLGSVSGFTREDKRLATEALRGAGPLRYEEQEVGRQGFTQEENAEVAKEIGAEFGKPAKEAYERSWGVENLPSSVSKQSSSAPRSRWKISPRTNWGRRPGP